MHRKVAAALVAALALAVAGCGGSGTETLTRAQLVRRIETACREGQREGQEQVRSAGASEGQATFIEALRVSQRTQLDALDGIEGSGAAQADFEAFREGVQARLEAIERVADADRADIESAMRAAQPAAEAAARRVEEAARSLGVEGCQ